MEPHSKSEPMNVVGQRGRRSATRGRSHRAGDWLSVRTYLAPLKTSRRFIGPSGPWASHGPGDIRWPMTAAPRMRPTDDTMG